jgi:hypothetical protein
MKLSGKNIKYSPSEIRAFALLSNKPQSTLQLSDKLYNKKQRPYNARQSALDTMNRLIKKVSINNESFVVRRDERRGPHPVKFWLEVKEGKRKSGDNGRM